MTQLEIEIQNIEAQIQGLKNTLQLLGDNPQAVQVIQQQINEHTAQLQEKKQELASQKQETVYEHLARIVGYSPELKKCIEETVDKLMQADISNASDPGLLLGKIQCGKTRAFVGVMGLAFDKGFDACIVLTKSDNGLVQQTIARMEYEFRDYLSNTNMNQACVIAVHSVEKGTILTPAQINTQKNIFVVHKNTTRLSYLTKLFKRTILKDKRVLIIDDEADFVSRAFYQRNQEVEVGKIALAIDKFSQIPAFCRYLQVTATPYSLFLQPDHSVNVQNGTVEPFRPRFTTLVPIHANYVGGKQYFVLSQDNTSMYSYLKHIVDDDCMDCLHFRNKHKKVFNNAATTEKYKELRRALMSYFTASSIRQLQEEKLYQRRYNSSFFMHVSTKKEDHDYELQVVEKILDVWKNDILENNGASIQLDFDASYSDFEESNKAGNEKKEISIYMPTKQEVWTRFVDIFTQGSYELQTVNSQSNSKLLGKDGQLKLSSPLNIFIGGFKLDRGITIDHMLGFFYGRRPQSKQTDTVLQHHRMYGNRSKEDMAVTRLHTTQTLYNAMEWIDNMDNQLRQIFVDAMENPEAPIPLVTIQFDPKQRIVPCGKNRLLISDLESFYSFKQIRPYGFQTDCATKLRPIIDGLDNVLQSIPGYKVDEPFLMDKNVAYQIIKNIRSTFIYNRSIDNNAGMEWDENAMITAIEKYIPEDDKIWCYIRVNRDMSRVRKNGEFVDSPADGNTDTPVAERYTQGSSARPFLMLFRENGRSEMKNGKNIGWRDAPFYWPCLRLPQNIKTCMYCK